MPRSTLLGLLSAAGLVGGLLAPAGASGQGLRPAPPAASGTAVAEPPGAPRAELAFVGSEGIASLRADGSGRRRVIAPSPQGDVDGQPAYSPDGASLAFSRAAAGSEEDVETARIVLAGADGSGLRVLTAPRGAFDSEPAWSPDGRRLAYVRSRFTETALVTALMVVERDGRGQRTLRRLVSRRTLASLGSPTWSRDGARVLYTRTALDRHAYFHPALYAVPAAGGRPRRLANDVGQADPSPDGTRLAVVSVRDRNGSTCGSDECSYNGEIAITDADGRHLRRLTRNAGDDATPRWSSRGDRLVFSSTRNFPVGEDPELYTMAPDGRCLTWLTNGSPGSASPAWRPDGSGATDAGGCGALGRAPRVDLTAGAALATRTGHAAYWLGTRTAGGLLLSGVQRDGREALVSYDDCGRFDPGACADPVSVGSSPTCSSRSSSAYLTRGPTLRRVRGALLTRLDAESGFSLFTGDVEVSLTSSSASAPGLARAAALVGELRPVGQARASAEPLPSPALPGRLLGRVERTAALVRQLRDVRAVARRQRLRPAEVRGRLRLARTLRPFGRVRALSCPPRRRSG